MLNQVVMVQMVPTLAYGQRHRFLLSGQQVGVVREIMEIQQAVQDILVVQAVVVDKIMVAQLQVVLAHRDKEIMEVLVHRLGQHQHVVEVAAVLEALDKLELLQE
jgi:hypothetical protein